MNFGRSGKASRSFFSDFNEGIDSCGCEFANVSIRPSVDAADEESMFASEATLRDSDPT